MIDKNKYMKEILYGCNLVNPLLCRSYITKNAVDLMLRYYGGAAINIDENNVFDLLVICVEWKEEDVGKLCLRYIYIINAIAI